MSYLAVPLSSTHKKKEFNCGEELLDHYLHTQAGQDTRRKLSACFILAGEKNRVKGYYTLASASIPAKLLPDDIRKKLPPAYSDLPVTLLGRLAVDSMYQGSGLGEMLLLDALKRSYDVAVSSIGSMAVIVDPLNPAATRFYTRYGFVLLPGSGKMFLPMHTIAQLFT